jgi:hypothetical protein
VSFICISHNLYISSTFGKLIHIRFCIFVCHKYINPNQLFSIKAEQIHTAITVVHLVDSRHCFDDQCKKGCVKKMCKKGQGSFCTERELSAEVIVTFSGFVFLHEFNERK